MLTYLVDDRGKNGEYAHFLRAHADSLPSFELEVMRNWRELTEQQVCAQPDLLLLDMHFDEGLIADFCGDLEALTESARFGGDRARAEAQIRRLQGVFIAQAFRAAGHTCPIVLFGTLPEAQASRTLEKFGPIRILEGLIFEEVLDALQWATRLNTHQNGRES